MRRVTVICIVICFFGSCTQVIEKEDPVINQVKVGQRFRVVLPENHEDGYTWMLTNGFNKSMIADFNPVWHGKEKGIYFDFKPISEGQTNLIFVKINYTDTISVKRYIVKISAQ